MGAGMKNFNSLESVRLNSWSKQRTGCSPGATHETIGRLSASARSLGVDSRDVVDFKLDRGNCGSSYDDLDETAQGMCCREPLHDGCSCGDVLSLES